MDKNYLEERLGECHNIPVIRTLKGRNPLNWVQVPLEAQQSLITPCCEWLRDYSVHHWNVLFCFCVVWTFLIFFFYLGIKTWVQFTSLNKWFSLPQNCVFQKSFIQLRKYHPALSLALKQDCFLHHLLWFHRPCCKPKETPRLCVLAFQRQTLHKYLPALGKVITTPWSRCRKALTKDVLNKAGYKYFKITRLSSACGERAHLTYPRKEGKLFSPVKG